MAGNGVYAEIIDGGNEEKATRVRFLLSNVEAGSIIGKGGSTISDFQSQSGARIQLSSNYKYFPGTSDRIVTVSAMEDLTLADALVYVCNQGVAKIVDLATLTGPCAVALGRSIVGVFTPSDELTEKVLAALEVTGEKLRRMPMEVSYWESMKAGVAYMVNTGGPQGGAIAAAAIFLKQVRLLFSSRRLPHQAPH
ncbi:unnamed protein product [Fraxinus pennsylvanica]|uniref:K Homology domain-containing protein n=1 Tax=Fraxinus pennsylvanica TaxID=56036 RepID=A0AAD2ECM0_9LAMI|nr:unnamed protein product [Fraxinus pennsylvanica]